ncbi:MAG: MBL fold metallo-hydrolase [Oscillospiraceae bacterium]|nr:MBL fold metallo-hydrolase [Oscillospiraceae bacterium]
MQIQYLGTGASEGVPGVFCRCDVCHHARQEGGKSVRRRSSMIVDKLLLIDMPPDLYSQALTFKVDLSLVRNILITHAHYEHFYPAELRNMLHPHAEQSEGIRLFGSRQVKEAFEKAIDSETMRRLRARCEFTEVFLFRPFETDGYVITPLKARHCDGAYIYLIESDGRVMLYGNDTGFFPEDTWDYLAEKTINLVSLDCTNPVQNDTPNHMTMEDNITVKRRMFQQKSSNNRTRYVATHFSHSGGLSHAQIDDKMRLHGITVAYDGLELRV